MNLNLKLLRRLFHIGNPLLWILLCGFSLLQAYGFARNMNEQMNWAFRLSYTVPIYLNYWLLSYLVFWYYRKVSPWQWPKVVFPLFGGAILFSSIHLISSSAMASGLMQALENPELAGQSYFQALMITLGWDYPIVTSSFMVYWLMILIMFGLDFYKKYKTQYTQNLELESQLTQSQLQTLKMQLQPHFLFNALNTISMMIRRQKDDQAVEMISGLSDLLRTTLTKQKDQFVSLKEELELIKKYLEIEQNRFKENIKVIYEIDEYSENVNVPNLILQPLIENAIKHGLSKTMGEGMIKISSKVENEQLNLSVFNTSPYLNTDDEESLSNNGIGLSNTKKRLSQLYKDKFEFNIAYQEPIGVLLEMVLPISFAK